MPDRGYVPDREKQKLPGPGAPAFGLRPVIHPASLFTEIHLIARAKETLLVSRKKFEGNMPAGLLHIGCQARPVKERIGMARQDRGNGFRFFMGTERGETDFAFHLIEIFPG